MSLCGCEEFKIIMLAFGVCDTLIENLSGFDVNDVHQLDGSKSFLTLSFSCPSCQMSYFEYMNIDGSSSYV